MSTDGPERKVTFELEPTPITFEKTKWYEHIYKPATCSTTLVSFNIKRYSIFIVCILLVYYGIRIVSKNKKWSLREKNADQQIQDITVMLIMATMSFTFGNYANTFDLWTIIGMVLGASVFTWITNLPSFKTNLVNISSWNIQVWTLFIISGFIVGMFIIYTIVGNYKCNSLIEITSYIAIVVIWLVLMYYYKKQDQIVHIHHYQIGWILTFLTSVDSIISKLFAGVGFGIFINGLAVYGPDPTVNVSE